MPLQKIFAFIYFFLLTFFAVSIAIKLPSVTLDASLHSVMPDHADCSNIKGNVAKAYDAKTQSRVIFLASDSSSTNGIDSLYEALDRYKGVDYIIGKQPRVVKTSELAFIKDNVSSLITENIRTKLIDSEFNENNYFEVIRDSKYKSYKNDPLNLSGYVGSHLEKEFIFTVKNGYYCINYLNTDWYYIEAILKPDISSFKARHEFVEYINSSISAIKINYPSIEILTRGDCYNSDYFSHEGFKDILYIGSACLILVFAVIYTAFLNSKLLFIIMLSTITGIIGGTYVVLLFYTNISVIIIGSYVGLTGTVCDYAIFYIFKRIKTKENINIFTLKHFKIPFILVTATDFIAYLAMVFAPVEPIKQFSVYSAGAITSTTFFVITIMPLLVSRADSVNQKLLFRFKKYLNFLNNPVFESAAVGFIFAVIIFGIYNYKVDDDFRHIQNLPVAMVNQDLQITEITSQTNSFKFVVVYDEDQQTMFEKYDAVKHILKQAKDRHIISAYKACPYNSYKTQIKDKAVLNSLTKDLSEYYRDNNLDTEVHEYTDKLLSFKDFINSTLGCEYKFLYHEDAENYSMIMLLQDIYDRDALDKALSVIPDAKVSDYYTDIEIVLHDFREKMYIVLLTLTCLIFVIFLVYFGLLDSIIYTLVNVMGVVFAMSALLIFDFSFNVYNLVPLTLILGISANYSLFFVKSKKENKEINLMAITTTFVTTVISLSVLTLSSAQVFRGIGLSITTGVIASYFLTTIVTQLLEKKFWKKTDIQPSKD